VRRLRRPLVAVLLALLAGQFLLGMVSNFYAQLPGSVPGVRGNFDNRLGASARWALLHGPPELQAHVALGLSLGLGAIALAAGALRVRERPWLPLAPLGLVAVAVAGAGLAGAAFLAYHQDDLYSLLMSIAFLAALFIYGALLYHPTDAEEAERGAAPANRTLVRTDRRSAGPARPAAAYPEDIRVLAHDAAIEIEEQQLHYAPEAPVRAGNSVSLLAVG
jgi:hypothetical protein